MRHLPTSDVIRCTSSIHGDWAKRLILFFDVVINDETEIVELKAKFDMNGKFTVSYADNAPHIPTYAGSAADNVSTAVNAAQYKQYANAMNEQLADMNKQLSDIKKKNNRHERLLERLPDIYNFLDYIKFYI